MRKVFTFSSIKSLKESAVFEDIKTCPHITATFDMLSGLRKEFPNEIAVDLIYTFEEKLLKDWESPDTVLQQFINLSSIIRGLKAAEKEENLRNSFQKNKSSVLDALRALAEADLYPDELNPQNAEERMFKHIWTEIENIDDSFGELRALFAQYTENPKHCASMLRQLSPCTYGDRIILHGFYYITPIQERILDLLEGCGKELVFLCYIDQAVPEVNEIWYKGLTEQRGFPPINQWVSGDLSCLKNRPFGTVFGNCPDFSSMSHISVLEYRSEIDFVHDVDRLLKDDFTILSTNPRECNNLLQEFYPEIYKRRHLLSYPVGQYIYRLHSMWNSKNQELELSIDDVQACFASGWVVCNGKNGIQYTDKLEGLRTYFSRCKSVNDWELCLQQLQDTKSSVLDPFEAHVSDMPAENQRWHKIMSDPFRNLSCFNYDNETLQEIINLIRHLIKTAETLFSSHDTISISTHLSKVREIINSRADDGCLLAEENAILDELSTRLKYSHIGIRSCLPGEIAEAIMLIIGGGILNPDNKEILSRNNEDLIKPLSQVESAPATSSGKIHLCLCDESRLPGSTPAYPWPLNRQMLAHISASSGSRRSVYLENLKFTIENLPLASRYLFYSLLQNDTVELSWISSEEGKSISSSPYVQILNQLFGVQIRTYQASSWTPDCIQAVMPADSPLTVKVDFTKAGSMEPNLDAALCPWRYIYSYILSEIPSYKTDFHYNFVLSNLISALTKASGMSQKRISDAVLSLFSYLRDVEKQQILDYSPYLQSSSTDALDGASYPSVRLNPHFLKRDLLDEAQNQLGTILQEGSKCFDGNLVKCGSYSLCMFCPHNSVCPHGIHDSREDN